METQGAQVKKLEANHAHLVNRNNFKVLIFQVSVTEIRGPSRVSGVGLLVPNKLDIGYCSVGSLISGCSRLH